MIRTNIIATAAGLFSASCPRCKSIEFRSVGLRNGFERAFGWLLQPFRCSLCGRHFFLFRRASVTET
jgi:transposase-like protein